MSNLMEKFDKEHTPPAPIMTPMEQKLVVLILNLEKKIPSIFELIINGIEFKLFKFGVSLWVRLS